MLLRRGSGRRRFRQTAELWLRAGRFRQGRHLGLPLPRGFGRHHGHRTRSAVSDHLGEDLQFATVLIAMAMLNAMLVGIVSRSISRKGRVGAARNRVGLRWRRVAIAKQIQQRRHHAATALRLRLVLNVAVGWRNVVAVRVVAGRCLMHGGRIRRLLRRTFGDDPRGRGPFEILIGVVLLGRRGGLLRLRLLLLRRPATIATHRRTELRHRVPRIVGSSIVRLHIGAIARVDIGPLPPGILERQP